MLSPEKRGTRISKRLKGLNNTDEEKQEEYKDEEDGNVKNESKEFDAPSTQPQSEHEKEPGPGRHTFRDPKSGRYCKKYELLGVEDL